MKLGFLSDAHGNPFGMEACINKLRSLGAERIYFLGDAVGYFPLVEEVIAILRREEIDCLLGNHDAMLCGLLPLDPSKDRIYGIGELKGRLDPRIKDEISRWPLRRQVEDRRVLLVHGSPRDELNEYIYPDSDLSWIGSIDTDAVFMGHTHIPFVKTIDNVLVVNVGSCGLPRDIGNQAACALFESRSKVVEILRVPFDAEELLTESRQRGSVAQSVKRCLGRRQLSKFEGEPHQ